MVFHGRTAVFENSFRYADSRNGFPYEVRVNKFVQTSQADNIRPYRILFRYSLLLITLSVSKQTPQSLRDSSPTGEPK